MTLAISALQCREAWKIDDGERDQLSEYLTSQGFTLDDLVEVFARHRLTTISFGRCTSVIKSERHMEFLQPERLWGNKMVSVYMPYELRVRHHFHVVLDRPSTSILDVLPNEKIEMQRVVNCIRLILETKLQIPAAVEAEWTFCQKGHLSNHFVVEVIPCREDSVGVLNALDKADCTAYVFFREWMITNLSRPTESDRTEDVRFWSRELNEAELPPFCESLEDEPVKVYTQVCVNKTSAAVALLDRVRNILALQGFSIERSYVSLESAERRAISPVKDYCDFCKDDRRVIKAQMIYETELAAIICNYRPIVTNHILIVPKRHVCSSSNLTQDEVVAMHELTLKVIRVFQERFGMDLDSIMYVQNGMEVNQTVMHCHKHFIPKKPSQLSQAIFQIDIDRVRRLLSADEMQQIGRDIGGAISKLDS